MSKILKGVLNYRQNLKAPMIKQLNQVSSTYSVVLKWYPIKSTGGLMVHILHVVVPGNWGHLGGSRLTQRPEDVGGLKLLRIH